MSSSFLLFFILVNRSLNIRRFSIISYSSESLSKSSPKLLVSITSSDDECFSLLEELFEFKDSIDELSEVLDFAYPLFDVALSESLSSSGCLEIYCKRVIEADRLSSI